MLRRILVSASAMVVLLSLVLTACTTPAQTPTATTAPAVAATNTAVPAATNTPAAAQTLWSDVRVKQAIAAAIDREAIVDRVFEGRNTPAYSMVPPGYQGATSPFKDKYGTRNLDMAKQLLTQAGFTTYKPFTFDLWYPPDHYGTTTADVMQVIKAQL